MDIKDLEMEVLKKGDLSSNDEDIEYKGYVDTGWVETEKEHKILHGTSYASTVDLYGGPVDNGGLISADTDSYIARWDRAGQTNVIEELLLNTICSNNISATKRLSINLNNSSSMANLRLKDDTYISESIFMFEGYTLNPTEESIKYNLVEVKADGYTL